MSVAKEANREIISFEKAKTPAKERVSVHPDDLIVLSKQDLARAKKYMDDQKNENRIEFAVDSLEEAKSKIERLIEFMNSGPQQLSLFVEG